jgi:phosphate-selective porin
MKSIGLLSAATLLATGAMWLAAPTANADVVTGTVTPQGATVVIVDSTGAVVAKLSSGPYQLQLPVGKFKARCTAPKEREQEFLSLSDPVTVNINCG